MQGFENFFILFVWNSVSSISVSFFGGRKCVDLVVTFNKGREETFAVSLQNRKSCIYIKYLTLVWSRELIHMNFAFFTRCKMHKTPVLLKNYSFQNFLNKSNFAFVCFCSKKFYSPQKIIMSCLCLRHGANLNSTSNVFAYFLIIFLRHDWFRVFLNEWGCIRSTP